MIMIMYMNKSCREQLSKEVVVPARSIDCCKDLQLVTREVQSGYAACWKRYRLATQNKRYKIEKVLGSERRER